ncbi:hypothetical protein LOTGIDRAFT_170568 [Lottia gigantea]|uniref:Vwde helical domain-containing protein n=1 Tax=Lottia gigantea TaxID=225164 RepID=V4B363_LOTGI|nr:hypothetical protein LOTGIDRAFT_170568 [Lottia gigantea]ESP04733.1 hypothetical protein LOTGIDRAFT_170568 [Lottia gigantea]
MKTSLQPLLIPLAIHLYSFSMILVSDLCGKKQYLPFTHQTKRSVNYDKTTTFTDRFMREGWYGSQDFIIPFVKPKRRHCGAIYPIFLQREPGFEKVIEDVTACILDCTYTMSIKALRCSPRLTIYKLTRPLNSNAAYCLDGFETGTELLDFDTNVTIDTNIRLVNGSEYEKEFSFKCSFPNPNQDSLVYKATWFVDDMMVYESYYTNYDDCDAVRSLTDTRLRDSNITTLGFQLHCNIRAANSINGKWMSSLPSTSRKKFIGMEVENPVINIKEGEQTTIKIRSTVPIGCFEPEGCTLTVTADIPQDADKKCEPTPTANGINIVKDTSLIQGKTCKMYSDPYLEDFYTHMGKSSFQMEGTFYLLQMDNVEVQLTDCATVGGGSCVCGVVVRVGRTAFMINHCNLENWYIDYILCDDGGDILDVRKKDETTFELFLPTDTKISITQIENSNIHWLNIYIYPSVRDIGKTSGLCGELTANPPSVQYDDAYFKSFRVRADVSLFDPGNWRTLPEWASNNTVRFQHCRCDERVAGGIDTSLNCSPVPGATTCSSDTDYTLFHKKKCINPLRKKRSLPLGLQPQILLHRRLRRDVSWKNGWTMDSANEYCSGLFNNSMVIKRCEGIRGINIEGAIETCVSDIQLSGTDVFALSAISSVSSQCLREARMNGTLREKKVDSNKTILELVKEVACPGECSDQGLCENGKCICNSEFIGSDCSVSLNEPPLAHNLEADGHCDLSQDDCTDVAVFGGRFVDAEQTKCQLLPFEIKNDQVIISEERIIQTAVFESIGEVTCKLPSRKRRRRSVDVPVIDETVTGYKVSVSNNGQNYSQQLNFIIYNTECINCSIDNSDKMNCSFSVNYCIIDAICYSNGLFQSNYCIIDAICYSNGLFQSNYCIIDAICYSNSLFQSNYCIIDAICYSNGLFQSNYCIIDAIYYSNGLFQSNYCIIDAICYSNGLFQSNYCIIDSIYYSNGLFQSNYCIIDAICYSNGLFQSNYCIIDAICYSNGLFQSNYCIIDAICYSNSLFQSNCCIIDAICYSNGLFQSNYCIIDTLCYSNGLFQFNYCIIDAICYSNGLFQSNYCIIDAIYYSNGLFQSNYCIIDAICYNAICYSNGLYQSNYCIIDAICYSNGLFQSNYCIIETICYSNGLFQSNYCIIDAICYSNGLFQPDHCIMHNRCYGNGTIYNTGDREFICRADSNVKAWHPDESDVQTQSTTPRNESPTFLCIVLNIFCNE